MSGARRQARMEAAEAARLIRARAIASQIPHAAVTLKDRPGSPLGEVSFGMARNLGKPEMHFRAARFDELTDDQILDRLRSAWGV
jgi:predicted amidohydrolase